MYKNFLVENFLISFSLITTHIFNSLAHFFAFLFLYFLLGGLQFGQYILPLIILKALYKILFPHFSHRPIISPRIFFYIILNILYIVVYCRLSQLLYFYKIFCRTCFHLIPLPLNLIILIICTCIILYILLNFLYHFLNHNCEIFFIVS